MLERTFVMVKPDGVQRGLVGDIITRFEKVGLKMVGMKLMHATEKQANDHYVLTDEWVEKVGNNTRDSFKKRGIECKETNEEIAKGIHDGLKSYLRENPVVAIVFEGYHAIDIGRKIVGITESRTADMGTVRGDYSLDSYDLSTDLKRAIRNVVHASGDKADAEKEIALWFNGEDLYDYEKHDWNVMIKHKK